MRLKEIRFTSVDQARKFMRNMGVSHGGSARMAGKAFPLNLLIQDMSCAEANILKQEMLILGGDAAIHRDVITGKQERSDVLLLGSRNQMRKLCMRMQKQCFSLPEIGSGIEQYLDDSGYAFIFRGNELVCGKRTHIMGILNVTPDSFSDGGLFRNPETAAEHAVLMEKNGADVIDIGGESSRPGADPVTADEEIGRIIPVFERLRDTVDIPLSVDTRNAEVARKALENGASIINDITGFEDPAMIEAAAGSGAGIIIMHMQGRPQTMQDDPCYNDVVADILSFLEERTQKAIRGGVKEQSIMIDPGIGFGKTAMHNIKILNRVSDFRTLGFPVLIGASRKSFIGKTIGLEPGERLPADTAVTAYCTGRGVDMVRVHDVKENAAARNMVRLLHNPETGDA